MVIRSIKHYRKQIKARIAHDGLFKQDFVTFVSVLGLLFPPHFFFPKKGNFSPMIFFSIFIHLINNQNHYCTQSEWVLSPLNISILTQLQKLILWHITQWSEQVWNSHKREKNRRKSQFPYDFIFRQRSENFVLIIKHSD